MALLELGGKRLPIAAGELTLGSDPSAGIVLAGTGTLPKHAILHTQADGQVVIRKATPAAEILINGVKLGAEPTPLLHGDKITIAGQELTLVDERRSGSTQYVQAVKPGASAQPRPSTSAPAGTTGGRIVSLTDGREYTITSNSLVFGRDAACDVVVVGKDVSRRHAEIVQSPKGYLLVDSSTNGTFVNEERVQGQRVLARGEVVRIGEEKFRFYADAAAAAAAAQPPAPPPPQPPPPASPLEPVQARPSQAAAGALATLLVRNGGLKGQRFQIRTPVVNIGRADYNDIVLADPSVSSAHAKVQRREGIWVVVDLDSTNGTFVDGEKLKGESPIAPGAMLRFGDVQLVFEPTDDALGMEKGGGTMVLSGFKPAPAAPPAPAAKPVAPAPPPAPARRPPPPKAQPKRAPAAAAEKKKGKGCGAGAIVLLAGSAGLVAFLRWILA